jgi:dTDP-4-amino-4,6-dideoxygalactose transaminase
MNIPLVDLAAQYRSIKEEVDAAIAEVIGATAFIGGRHVDAFEKAFAQYSSVKHCIGVGNGTDALFITLRTLGIGRGDEVITVANSFIATSEAISLTGAKVVFVDIDPTTYNIDVNAIEAKINRNTKAIVPVHLYGQPADMDPVIALAAKHGLKVVEDCAQAHGARYKGRPIGTMGDAATFSFYPGKNLGAYGDGGAIVTNNDELALKAKMFANHGRVEKYDHAMEGVNSRLDGLQAAILKVKLTHLPEWNEARRRHAHLYTKLLTHPGVTKPTESANLIAVYHLYVIRVKRELRDSLQKHLLAKGISTGIHYPIPLPKLKAYAYLNHTEKDFPRAYAAAGEILSLPMYAELDETKIAFIAEQVNTFLANNGG